jgi:hypothetical protein
MTPETKGFTEFIQDYRRLSSACRERKPAAMALSARELSRTIVRFKLAPAELRRLDWR